MFQDLIEQLRDNPAARDLARRAVGETLPRKGPFLKGRATAGVLTSVLLPAGSGLGATSLAVYGDLRFAIEQGADLTGVIEAVISGDAQSPLPSRTPRNLCECQ